MKRAAFTLVELLVVIAIIGVLVALLLPAVQTARESARRTQCIARVNQMALALNLAHDSSRAYPPARFESHKDDRQKCGNGWEPTWLVRVLPYLEEGAVYSDWQLYDPWNLQTDMARTTPVTSFLCPTRRAPDRGVASREVAASGYEEFNAPCGCVFTRPKSDPEKVLGAASDYAGNHGDLSPGAWGEPTDFYYGGNGTGVLISSRPKCNGESVVSWKDKIAAKHIKDGLSKTFLIGEKHIRALEIQKWPDDSPAYDGDYLPASSRVAGPGAPLARGPQDPMERPLSFGSVHPGVCNFAFADGSVRSIEVQASTRTLSQFSNRNNRSVSERNEPPANIR